LELAIAASSADAADAASKCSIPAGKPEDDEMELAIAASNIEAAEKASLVEAIAQQEARELEEALKLSGSFSGAAPEPCVTTEVELTGDPDIDAAIKASLSGSLRPSAAAEPEYTGDADVDEAIKASLSMAAPYSHRKEEEEEEEDELARAIKASLEDAPATTARRATEKSLRSSVAESDGSCTMESIVVGMDTSGDENELAERTLDPLPETSNPCLTEEARSSTDAGVDTVEPMSETHDKAIAAEATPTVAQTSASPVTVEERSTPCDDPTSAVEATAGCPKVLKVSLADDTRRLQAVWSDEANSNEVIAAISRAVQQGFDLTSSTSFALKYKDHDGDTLTLVESTVEDFLSSQPAPFRICVEILDQELHYVGPPSSDAF